MVPYLDHTGIQGDGFGDAVHGQITGDFGTAIGAGGDLCRYEGDLGKFSGIKEVRRFQVGVTLGVIGVYGPGLNADADLAG